MDSERRKVNSQTMTGRGSKGKCEGRSNYIYITKLIDFGRMYTMQNRREVENERHKVDYKTMIGRGRKAKS